MILLIRLLPLQAYLDITIRETRADAIPVLLLSVPTIDHVRDLILEILERIGDRLTKERGAKGPAVRPSVPLVVIPATPERANQELLQRALPETRVAETAIRKTRNDLTIAIIMGGTVLLSWRRLFLVTMRTLLTLVMTTPICPIHLPKFRTPLIPDGYAGPATPHAHRDPLLTIR